MTFGVLSRRMHWEGTREGGWEDGRTGGWEIVACGVLLSRRQYGRNGRQGGRDVWGFC